MPNICSGIKDPVKRKRCLQRFRSEQSTPPDEAVKQKSKRASGTTKSGRY